MSNNNDFGNSLAVRPVTKFKTKANLEMDLEDLYIAQRASRKHNKRSEDMVAFEVDLYANLSRLCAEINSRTYAPLHNYSFMHRRSAKPREVFAAEPELKAIMAYSLMRISAFVERRLSPRTFNNRIGMGAQLAVNTLINDIYEVSEGYTKEAWIIKIDYKGFFPNMDRDYAWGLMTGILVNDYHRADKEDVAYCLKTACFCNPRTSARKSPIWEWADYPSYKSVYMRPENKGGLIGYTFWQMIASLYPLEIDRYIATHITPHFVRYVDDTVMVTSNKEAVLAQMPELRRRLSVIGVTLHPKKFYCQPYRHGVEFLGYYIRPERAHLKRRTVRKAFIVARSRERGKRNYIDAINSYLGMIKATSDTDTAKALLDAIERPGITKDYINFKIATV